MGKKKKQEKQKKQKEKLKKLEKLEKQKRLEKQEKPEKQDKPKRQEKQEKTEKLEKQKRLEKQEKPYQIYELDGTCLGQDALHPVGMLAATAQGALAVIGRSKDKQAQRTAWQWVERL